jgi:uncharacterized membrane protein YhaH (DUF805 family)
MFRAYRRYADFAGRSNRAEYWLFALSVVLFTLLAGFVVGLAGSIVGDADGLVFFSGLGLWLLAILVPSFAVNVRRLHDIDMSGWWILIALAPGVGALALLVMHLLPGTDGSNRFGPPPTPRTPDLAPAA